jgi:hypothetical protein
VQPQGLSYKAHWEALGCALCLLNTPEISGTGPMRSRGFCPDSRRPRARVPLVVWAWDFSYGGGGVTAVSRAPTVCRYSDVCLFREPAP